MPNRPNFPIPADIHAPLQCIQLCIPNEPTYKSVFAGLIYELTYWYNWQRTDGNEGAQCANVWKEIYNSIDWSTMSCCPQIIGTRFTDTGEMEVTYDGTTWVPASDSGADPRDTSPQLPPLPTTGSVFDNRCRSATNVVSAMQTAVETFGAELGTVGSILALAGAIALAVVGVFAVPPSATVLIPIVIALAQAIYSIASGTYLALFTSDVYDDLQCILYCHCGSDGTFTQQNYLDILTAIDSASWDSNVALTFTSVLRGWILAGLNAAARGGSLSTGDCSDCDCGGCATHFTDTQGFGTIIDSGADFVTLQSQFFTSPFNYNVARVVSDLGAGSCCTMVSIELLSGSSYGTASGFTGVFPAGQTTPPSPMGDYCAFQFEQDGAESPFTVKITFLT